MWLRYGRYRKQTTSIKKFPSPRVCLCVEMEHPIKTANRAAPCALRPCSHFWTGAPFICQIPICPGWPYVLLK